MGQRTKTSRLVRGGAFRGLSPGLGDVGSVDPAIVHGLALWLKADSLALNDNDPVATWADQSGAGNNVTQGTAGKRPLFKANIVNGWPVVRFDGTDDVLRAASSAFLDAPAQLSVFAVVKAVAPTAVIQKVFGKSDAAGTTGWRFYLNATNDGNVVFRSNWGVPNGASGVNTDWRILEAYYASGDQKVFINGAQVATGTSTSPSVTNALIFGIGASAADTKYLNGDIAEIIVTTSAPLANRQGVVQYLGNKYGLLV